MLYKSILILILLSADISAQNLRNIENSMLSDSLSSFFYYSIKDPVPFSDPQSLIDTERRSQLSDRYHDQIDYEDFIYRTRVQNYNYNYNYRYNKLQSKLNFQY